MKRAVKIVTTLTQDELFWLALGLEHLQESQHYLRTNAKDNQTRSQAWRNQQKAAAVLRKIRQLQEAPGFD